MRRFSALSVIAVILAFFSQNVSAQKYHERDFDYFPRHEMYLQYGTPSAIEFMGKTRNVINDPDPAYTRVCESRNHKYSGVAGLGYNFSTSPNLSFGIYGGFSWSQADFYTISEDGKPVKEFLTYRSSIKNWTVMADAHFAWWQEGSMELSSGIYLGACFIDESLTENKYPQWDKEDDRVMFAYHITAAKFRIGETVGGFAELGFGYRGILNIGLSIRL